MLKINIDFQLHIHVHRNDKTVSLPNAPVPTFTQYIKQQISSVYQQGRFSTANNYQTALHSFLRFREQEDIPLQELSSSMIADYERWLKNRRISMNTISCYLRSLRSIYNKAVSEHLITDRHPFEKSFTGYPETEKRSISTTDIHKLKELPIEKKSCLHLVRDIFLFCIFTCGMPFVDIAFLRKSQISDDGYLTYKRHKTNQQIRMKLLPCAQEIIQKYQSNDSVYVFPILDTIQPEEAHKQYRNKLSYYNKLLKELGNRAGISHKLTSYVSRHSWASLAYEQNTDVAVISKGLGHTSTRTTYVYIKGIDDTRLDDANQKVIRKIMGKKN